MKKENKRSSKLRSGVPDRPSMPQSYGLKSGRKGMLQWTRVTDELTRSRNYWVVTANLGGKVHAAPVWGIWLGDEFWFSTDPNSRKGRDISGNHSVVVHLEKGDDAVIIEGSAERIPNASIPSEFSLFYEKKYGLNVDVSNPSYAIYRVVPHSVYAWTEKNFPENATRWRFSRTG